MRVLVVASHSGGHISPAIAFCQGLIAKNNKIEINFVTTDGQIEKKLLNDNFNAIYFKRKKITLLTSYKLIVLFFQAQALIRKLNPNLIVGFGGYLSIPFIVCAHFKRISNFIHEQNVRLGLANWLLVRFSDKIIFSFPNTQVSGKLKDKVLLLGLPLRKELMSVDKKEARRYFGLDTDNFTILVMGGSQGSSKINSQVTKILKDKDFFGIQVIHITGSSDYEKVVQEYKNLKIKFKVSVFIDRMDYAFSACDLVICRAGASTIAEIIALKVPSVLVPYPYAKQHQLDNARFLADRNAAILIEDEFFSEEILKQKIIYFKNNPDKLKQISHSLSEINISGGRDKIVELAFSLAQ